MPGRLTLSGAKGALVLVRPDLGLTLSGAAGSLSLSEWIPAPPVAEEGGPDYMPGPVLMGHTGSTYAMPGWKGPFSSSYPLLANAAVAIPIYTPWPLSSALVAVNVTSAVAGSSVRVALFESQGLAPGTFRPGALVEDFGTVSTATTGVKSLAISPALAIEGWYWALVLSSHNNVYLRAFDTATDSPVSGGTTSGPGTWPVARGSLVLATNTAWVGDGFYADLSEEPIQGETFNGATPVLWFEVA